MRDFVENHEAHQDLKLLARLLRYFKPYTAKFVWAFLLMIITTFTNMIMPLASGLAIDLMVDPAFSLEQKITVVIIGAAILLVITGLSILIGYFQSIMLQRIGQKITDQMRNEVFAHIE
jgi:ATP-binding cassette subfamily B protein